MDMSAKQMRGRQVELILHRPVPREDAVVLAAVKDKACGWRCRAIL
jgi:hypothetical protein